MTEFLGIPLDTDLLPADQVELPELDEPDIRDALDAIAAADDAEVPAVEARLLEQSDNRGEDAPGFQEGS